jgi:hypothetical protein
MLLFHFVLRMLWPPFGNPKPVLVLSDTHLSPNDNDEDAKPSAELMVAAEETDDPWEESSDDGWFILHDRTEHRLDGTVKDKGRPNEETTRSTECPKDKYDMCKEEDDLCKGPKSEQGGAPIQASTAATSEALRPQEAPDSTPVEAAAPSVMPLACPTDDEGFELDRPQGRSWAQRHQRARSEAEREAKLVESRQFSSTFKLDPPVPSELLSILARNPPKKKKKMHDKALRDGHEPQTLRVKKSSNAKCYAPQHHPPPIANDSGPIPAETADGLDPRDQDESKGSCHGSVSEKIPAYYWAHYERS